MPTMQILKKGFSKRKKPMELDPAERSRLIKLKEYRERDQQAAINEAKYGKFLNNIRKKIVRKIKDAERFSPKISLSPEGRSKQMRSITLDKINAMKERINVIAEQGKYLEKQKYYPENPFKGLYTIKYKKEVTGEKLRERGYQEGKHITEKQYKELVYRNKQAHETAVEELNRMEFLYSLKRQERWLSGKNVGDFKDIHEKTINYLIKKYERGSISAERLKELMLVIDSGVKSVIAQNRLLQKTKLTTHNDLHSRVVGLVLADFIRTGNLGEFNRTINSITKDINNRSKLFSSLSELEEYYTKRNRRLI